MAANRAFEVATSDDLIEDALSLLRPEDLLPVWCYIDHLEGDRLIRRSTAARWKHAIFDSMTRCGMEPDMFLDALPGVARFHPQPRVH